MRTMFFTVFLGLAPLMLVGCGQANNTTANEHAGTATPIAAPTIETLLALDRGATEAYLKGDSKHFERILSDRFVMYAGGKRMDKATVVKMIASNHCDVKGWQLEDPQMAKVDKDTYVLSYKGSFDGSCTEAGGRSMKVPSPVRAATVWFRSGDKWMAAFHGENQLIDPQKPPSAEAEGNKKEPQKEDKSAGNGNAVAAADPSTDAMMAVEKAVWDAWKAKDVKRLEELTTKELSFQNIFGSFFANKADTLKDWTGPKCDVKSVSVTDGTGVLLSTNVGLLTRTGTAEGTCDGQELTRVPVYGASVFVKDGDSWKLAFTLNQL